MPADLPPTPRTTTVVVMGVSGSGKTTVAQALAHQLGWDFAEGDAFHSDANVRKMRSGHALDDEDRWPWLEAIRAWVAQSEERGESGVLTCSALKLSYRDLLRTGNDSVWFAYLAADPEVLLDRVTRRSGHYMPPSLLDSQLETLEPLHDDEQGLTLDADQPRDVVVGQLVDALRAEHRVA